MKTVLFCCAAMLVGTNTLNAEPAETPFTILVGEPSFLPEAATLAKTMDHENGLRIMPVVGHGSVQAVQDLENFQMLDAALITADSLTYVKAQNLMDQGDQRVTYISAVKPLPIMLVASKSIANVTALAGKKIATGSADTASFASGELLMGAMEVPFLRVTASQENAVDALLSGDADAAFFVGTPANFAKLGRNFKILPLVMPQELAGTYAPAKLTNADAPGLLAQGQELDTVSTELVLASAVNPSKDHARTLKAFTTELFRQTADSETVLRQELPGWTREANAAALVKAMGPAEPTIMPTGDKP